jgi:hypothetical protein
MGMTGDARTTPRIAYRAATEDDVEAEYAVVIAAEGDLLRRHGFDWGQPADRW